MGRVCGSPERVRTRSQRRRVSEGTEVGPTRKLRTTTEYVAPGGQGEDGRGWEWSVTCGRCECHVHSPGSMGERRRHPASFSCRQVTCHQQS